MAVVVLTAAVAAPATAAEYCVTCASPAAMYACVVEGAAPDAPPDAREQLLCIAALAKSGNHESCSVPRSAPKPCPGILKIVALPEAGLPALPADAARADPDGAAEGAEPAPKAPRTVEELAKKTVETSQQGLETAGKAVTGTAKKAGEKVEEAGGAVGRAAKKTWDCMLSLFSDC